MSIQYIIIGKPGCPYCTRAKDLLESKNIGFTYRDIQQVNSGDIAKLERIAGGDFYTVPQIFKYKQGGGLDYVGGYTELRESFNI